MKSKTDDVTVVSYIDYPDGQVIPFDNLSEDERLAFSHDVCNRIRNTLSQIFDADVG